MNITPFKISVGQDVVDDLRSRLARTRWIDEVAEAGWDYGTNLAYLKELAAYWQNDFDWRAQEAKLNQFAQFRAEIDGLNVHFIHERGKGSNALPIILTHGWPDSFYRMTKIIPMLTDPARFGGDPADSFDVIVPSLPGFGFSDRPRERGFNEEKIADTWVKLMDGLGYQKFAAMGGDVGAVVSMYLGHRHANRLVGLHLTDVSYPQQPPEGLEADGGEYFRRLGAWFGENGGYIMQQSTKPQTLAFGLNDSPVGLAAWIVEKFRAWSDSEGDVEKRFSKDELLTNIMIYWVTETISSSVRLYREGGQPEQALYPAPRIEVPTAIAQFPVDLLPPRSWTERALNVQRWTDMPRGGHFSALEEPQLLVEDIRTFFRSLR